MPTGLYMHVWGKFVEERLLNQRVSLTLVREHRAQAGQEMQRDSGTKQAWEGRTGHAGHRPQVVPLPRSVPEQTFIEI